MRFYEFATAQPVLKISQQQQARQAGLQSNTPQTPWPQNTQPTPAPRSVKVYPEQWQHEWVQKYLAARIARNAQTIQPSDEDIAKAFMLYSDARRQADQDYQASQGEPDDEDGWGDDHRWVRRDQINSTVAKISFCNPQVFLTGNDGKKNGFIAVIVDTEGNAIGLPSFK